MRPSSKRAAIAPFLAMEMARAAQARAESGRSIIRFDVGQPFAGAPAGAITAVAEAFQHKRLGYTEGLGARALREKIADLYARRYGLSIDPGRIAITAGASAGFVLAFLALFNTGDRVALAAPGYPPYRHILTALGLEPAIVEAAQNEHYQLSAHHVREAAAVGPLAGALAASPANPTGAMLSRVELAALAGAARACGAAFISDEIYHGLTYGPECVSALEVDDEAIVINSFSKYWAMTGWRVGWIVAPPHLIDAIERLSQNLFVSAPAPSQAAALAALDGEEECEAVRAVYAANRALLMEALPKLGMPVIAPPDGAFYLLCDISAHDPDSLHFCQRALDEADVALTTGLDFDDARGRGWVRLAYARRTDQVEDGVARLRRWLGR